MEDFTRSREDKTIWSERPRYTGIEITYSARISALKKIPFLNTFLQQVREAAKTDADYQKFLKETPSEKQRVIEEDLIYYKGRLQIPDSNRIKL